MNTEELIEALKKFPKDAIPVVHLEADTLITLTIGELKLEEGNRVEMTFGGEL